VKIRQRVFAGETDVRAMITLAQLAATENLHVVDLPYRLSSWALDRPENIGLWVDADGHLLAWAVLQTPFWTIDYACHPETNGTLHKEVLLWADHRARQAVPTASGHPCWFVTAFPGQTDRIRDIETAGFVSQANVGKESWSKVLLQRPSQTPVADYTLPGGTVIRPLAGETEVEAYVQLHRAVFESGNMTVGWRSRTLRQAEYLSDLDLVAIAPDGRLAAFCICWLSKAAGRKPSGQVEPLGVHQSYRRLGLGRAILAEGLRRLYAFGAESVCVETDKYRNDALDLYRSVGFRHGQDVLVYRKDYLEAHP
jgi:mycothiol synthase